VLAELKEEVNGLGWAVERERSLKTDRDAAALAKRTPNSRRR